MTGPSVAVKAECDCVFEIVSTAISLRIDVMYFDVARVEPMAYAAMCCRSLYSFGFNYRREWHKGSKRSCRMGNNKRIAYLRRTNRLLYGYICNGRLWPDSARRHITPTDSYRCVAAVHAASHERSLRPMPRRSMPTPRTAFFDQSRPPSKQAATVAPGCPSHRLVGAARLLPGQNRLAGVAQNVPVALRGQGVVQGLE